MRRNNTGSLSIDYALLIAVLVAVLLGMAVYLKRSLSGKYKEAGDTFGRGRQYEPGTTVVK